VTAATLRFCPLVGESPNSPHLIMTAFTRPTPQGSLHNHTKNGEDTNPYGREKRHYHKFKESAGLMPRNIARIVRTRNQLKYKRPTKREVWPQK